MEEQMEEQFVSGAGAATDDMFHQHTKKQQENFSSNQYKAGFNEQIKGQRAQTTRDGHPEYLHAEKQQQNVSETHYKQQAAKARQTTNVDGESFSIQQAQKAQKIVVDKLQNGRDAIKQMGLDRDWTQDVEQKKHMHNKYMQGIGYSEEAQEAMRNEAYMPVTMTQIYQQSKAMKDKIGGHNYDADSKIAASKTQYPVNESAGYEMQKNLAKKNSDYKKEYYNTRHENNMGKALAGTAQVQQAAKNQTNASDNQYKIGAAELRRLVQLNESPELTQARVNAHNLSRKAYKAGYIAMINSKKENRKLEDFPEYMAAKKAASAASKVLYELEAKAMAEHPLGIQKDHASIVNAKKTTDILNETKYKESMTANNESSKGYMTMDADVHPVVVQSNYKKAMQTNYGYSKEAQDMMTEPDYPVSETEFYKQKKMLAPFMSIKNYRETADNDNQRPKFDQSKTEKYQQDRNLNKTISGYKTIIHEQRGFEEALAETPLMEQAAKDKINNSETRYRAGNRKMMENYKPELDTPLNRQARLNQQHISRIEYKKAHAKYLADHEKVRKLMDHPEYVQARTIQKMTQDSLYKQAAMQANATPVGIQLDTPSVKLAKQNQENVSDRLYVKDLPDTNAKYKGFQTMDAASHPIVTKSAYFNTMNSDARYVQDSKEEQAEIYYPVNMTPGYEQQKTVQPYNSDKHYKKDLNNNKDYQYNYATTEHYEQNKTLDKVKTNYDAQFAEQKGQNTQFSKGFIESDQYNALKNVSKNVSDSLYTTGAKEALKRNCIPVDSMTNEHIKKAQEISSDLKYHEGYEHSVKGKLEAKPIDCHLDYIQSAANQTNVSDNAYQREGEKLKHQYTMVRDDLHIDHPIRVSEHVNDRAYYQSRIDTIDKYKGYMTMEASKHPLVTKAAHDNMLMSEAGYRQEWNDEKVEPMFCPNVTEGYQLTAKLKETLGTAYTRKANKEREACFFDAATTQQYEDQRKLKNLTDVQYKKNYLTEIAAGKGYQHMPAVTQEMEQIKNLKPYQSDAIYSRAAKALSGKYNLTIDDHLLTHQMKVSDITSERLYKKGYVDQLLGKTAQDAGIAYPRLLELTQQAKELNEQNYQKAARENHRSHNVGVDAMVMAQQKLNSQVVDNYNYSKTRREVVASMKHYQTMDASLHPITLKKNLDQMLYSNAGYVQDWNEDKIEIDFRADGTPIYETVQSLKAFTDANYKYKAKKTMSENTFNVAQTETYDTIRKLKEVQAQKYKAHATELNEHPKGIDKDETMDISQKLAPVLSQHRYTEAAKKLAEKYNINMDTMSIVQAMKVSEAVNNRLYVAGYKAQIVGKAPQDQQLANYPVEKSQYDLAKVVGNKAYTEAGNKIKMSGKLPLDCIAFKHAENSALIASDALYKKSRVEVIAKMKAWQNMDSSLHPIVQEKNYQNALNSNALYTKEAKEDLEAPMFLAQSTEFYEQNKKLKEVMGNYKKKEPLS